MHSQVWAYIKALALADVNLKAERKEWNNLVMQAMLKQVSELWDGWFGVAEGNLLLQLMGILDSTKINTKGKALLWPVHYPEACVMLSLTLSHLFMLRQNVSRSVIILLGFHLGKSWYAIEDSCWHICNYTVTASAAVVEICVWEIIEEVPKARLNLELVLNSEWETWGEGQINLDNVQHC